MTQHILVTQAQPEQWQIVNEGYHSQHCEQQKGDGCRLGPDYLKERPHADLLVDTDAVINLA